MVGVSESNGNNPGENNALYSELWHACAGSHVYVPQVEEKVYYFLQGHIEQVEAYTKKDGNVEMPIYNLPPKILCRVVHVNLKAEPYTDEVFAQLTLIAMTKKEELSSKNEKFKSKSPVPNSRVFNKILTPSDTSTHGGFSVPKRQADQCLPPLDMTQAPPVQELVAKDLHGFEWNFRHIFRGQPKRHLLTSGWSTFVSSKKLVAGDEFIFLRGENGELRVGARRATKPQSNVSASVISGHSMQHGILSNASHAIMTGSIFNVYYRPWTDPSECLVPYDQYRESVKMDYSIGTRIRMKVDGEKCAEKRLFGTIVGAQDFDPIRWPGSEWRCLEVQWDGDDKPGENLHPKRVSPWNIEPVDRTNMKHSSDSTRQKRSYEADSSSPGFSSLTKDGSMQGATDPTAKKHASSRVLQGQEGSRKSPQESNPESRECEADQPNGGRKIMIFGVNMLCSGAPELPSQQFATSSGLRSPRAASPIPRSNLSESVDASDSSKKSDAGVLAGRRCKNCRFVSNRTCTKVLKYGTPLGRSVNLARFEGYGELVRELDDMFEFEGSLTDKSSGWRVTYTDSEGDTMLLGDFPWQFSTTKPILSKTKLMMFLILKSPERTNLFSLIFRRLECNFYREFRSMVQRMFIYPKEELAGLNAASM